MDSVKSHLEKMTLWPVEHFWLTFFPDQHWICANLEKKVSQKCSTALVRVSFFRSDFLQNPYFNNQLVQNILKTEDLLIWIENRYNIITLRGAIIFALCDKNIIQLFKDQTCLGVQSWFFFFRVTSLQMMYIRDVYLHLILWGTRWPNSRYEHSILEWLQKKGFKSKAPQIDVSKGIVKVSSVQEACSKFFWVHSLEFEILQVTWKKRASDP